jgi:putative OmpL-like beta-barrel porin-2/carboxypeptidase family protein
METLMKIQRCMQKIVLSVLTTALVLPAVADELSTPVAGVVHGTIVGVVTNAAKLPVAGATVTATSIDSGDIRSTVSTSDGTYSFANLPPGVWAIASQVEGAPDVVVPSVQVVAGKATRHDLAMNIPGAAPSTSPTLAAAPQAAAAESAQTIPVALQAPAAGPAVDNDTPFAFGDFTWLNASPRNHQPVFDTKFFTPDVRLDVNYLQSLNHPHDHTIVGSTEEFRSGEFQLEQISFGGDFHWDNVRARILTMFGNFATTTPRNDASAGVGQWDLRGAYRYLSEANAGYHFDVNHGLNIDAGIFVSYVGLFSYYNYDNWTYQPSYVSSNTPWFFNGLRVQWFPTNTLKIEPWIINGWQSYAKYNSHPGVGGQILWMPKESLKLVFNNYGVGQDNLVNTPGNPLARTTRVHTDDSIEVRYFNRTGAKGLSKAAFSFTVDAGCQYGGGIHCTGGPNQSAFFGMMLYNRLWFDNDLYAITIGGGMMSNPGRYLTLLPPINGADAATGSPYFTENPGQTANMWDSTINFQYMPKDWITWWAEVGYRHSNIPYFAGSGGVTPPGGNNGASQNYACNSGASAGTADPNGAAGACAGQGGIWYPDLSKHQATIGGGILVKF